MHALDRIISARPKVRSLFGLVAIVVLAAACSAPAASAPATVAAPPSAPSAPLSSGLSPVPTPAPTPVPTAGQAGIPAPGAPPRTAEEAAALVIASDARFAGIRPLDPNMIGQSSWYEVRQGLVGWVVVITRGWGDCQAGCISRHTWTYAVDPTGTLTLTAEGGDAIGGAGSGTPGGGASGQVPPEIPVPADPGPWLVGYASSGPVCPVETSPPDPACAARPVAGAVVIVRAANGSEVARTTTGADGIYRVAVPAGSYTVEGQPVVGLMGAPAAVGVDVAGGAGASTRVDLAYDTGIR